MICYVRDWSGLHLDGRSYKDVIGETFDKVEYVSITIHLDPDSDAAFGFTIDASELLDELYENVLKPGYKSKAKWLITFDNFNQAKEIVFPTQMERY